jgi:AraC family transcriptional activator of pobA
MKQRRALPLGFSQHPSLPIRLIGPDFGHLPPEAAAPYEAESRLSYYFFHFQWAGTTRLDLDTGAATIGPQEALFLLPHQLRPRLASASRSGYYKLGFSEDCLARLPQAYPFLLNPLQQSKIQFTTAAAARVRIVFELLISLLQSDDTTPDVLLAHLHSLLTELNAAYFAASAPPPEGLAKYITFSLFVEDNFTEHPSIEHIARELALSTDSLYELVKRHAGLSPKEFLTQRLILEAKRRLSAQERVSVKELAYALGFQDPAYFSRLFKKATGKTVAAFFQDLS